MIGLIGIEPLARIEDLPLDHLAHLSDARGVFEHADHSSPRREHGYCLDDVARALVVTLREAGDVAASPGAAELAETYLRFVEAAIQPDGRAHNRLDQWGSWTDEPGLGDWWGRAVLALGFAAANAPEEFTRRRALRAFLRAAQQRSPHLRAMASAAIGAAEVLQRDLSPELARAAESLLRDAVAAIPDAGAESSGAESSDAESSDAAWPWPEPRLRYGNATIAEALLFAGETLGEPHLVERGLHALAFVLRIETRAGHLSVTGVDGRGPGEAAPQFDQQPIEVAAIADACARAVQLGHGELWRSAVRMSWAWFLGDNDSGVLMVDPETGAGFDGLERNGRNENRGAESTLAALSTFQRSRELGRGLAAERRS